MATKSSNIQGNPYHDEEGKFTSAETSSVSKTKESGKLFSIRLKPNFDINAMKQGLQQVKLVANSNNTMQIGSYQEASTIEEAIEIGKKILPSCEVNYSQGCDIEKVNELNKALSDISNRFPGFVQNGLLNAFGDGLSLNEDRMSNIIVNSAINVIKNDKHFRKIYDRFFDESKMKFNLKDEDKYSEQVLRHFMCLDKGFDMKDYTQQYGGGNAMAYYQVSQDKMVGTDLPGGKGINGAIKIYTNVLKKPTQKEINEMQYSIASGFHFDYGEHSYTYGTGVHELGHSIFTIAYKKCTDEEREELNQLLHDGFTKDYHQVSGYGHTNAYEQEAEAVADVMCRGNNATLHNKKMVGWLDKVHTRLKGAGEI